MDNQFSTEINSQSDAELFTWRFMPEEIRKPDFGDPKICKIEPNSRQTILLNNSSDENLLENLEFELSENSELNLITLQNLEFNQEFFSKQKFRLQKNAILNHQAFNLSGKIIRTELEIEFIGEYGQAEIAGVSFAKFGEHFESHINIEHLAANCQSNLQYNSIAKDQNTSLVWLANALISASAEKTLTFVKNRNLLLNFGPKVNSVPNLEILTGDIAGAGHASATGRFDEEQLFYFESRGINADLAKKMMVFSYFDESLQKIQNPELESRVHKILEKQLSRKSKGKND